MHVHMPKPLHGWREFVHEVVIIVLGVLIALALEQGVERARWAHQVHDARTAIHREMTFDLAEVADRVRVAPCVDRHIAEAQKRIEASAATGSVPPGPTNLETPGRLILVGDYEAQQAAQNLVHFPPDELSALGLWYDQMRSFKEWINVEESAWVGLSLVAQGGAKMGPLDIALLRRDLATAKEMELLTVLNGRRQIARAHAMGVAPGPSRSDWVQLMCRSASS